MLQDGPTTFSQDTKRLPTPMLIPLLLRAFRGTHLRRLSIAPRLYNLSKYPSFIHEELKDVPRSKQTKSLPKARKRILILSPEETKDKKFSRYLKDVNKKARRASSKPVLKLIDDDSVHSIGSSTTSNEILLDSVEMFKPKSREVSLAKKSSIISDLGKSFTKPQLLDYIKQNHNTTRGLKSAPKHKVATFIVEKLWTTNVSGVSKLEDLFVTEPVTLTQLEMFLLLLCNGLVLKHIRSAVSKIQFDRKSNQLLLTGTPQQIENAKINLMLDLESANKEEIDLQTVKSLALQKHGSFDVKDVSNNTEVFFQHLENDKYELYAFNKNQLKRTKRLLLWLLNYNPHNKEFLHLPEGSQLLKMLPFKDDDSLSWKDRNKNLYVVERLNTNPNTLLVDELAKFSDSALADVDLDEELWHDEDDKLSLRRAAEEKIDESGWDLLESLGFGKSKKNNATKMDQTISYKATLSQSQRDQIYKELTDFSYKQNLPGVAKAQLDPKIFTVTLGNILFEAESNESGVLPPILSLGEHKLFQFNSNVTLAHDKLLSIQQGEGEGAVLKDPHIYSLQFKFTPSPFTHGANVMTNEHMDYPPVEMWVQLKKNLVPDIDSLHLVSVEAENSSLVCLPKAKSDMKVTCQLTGRVIQELDEQDFTQQTITETLGSTIDRYQRFKSQPGVIEFLQNSQLDFSGKTPTSIAPNIDLVINGKKVRYHYLNVSYRREIAFEVPHSNGEDLMVHVSVVDGGSLGGKRIEIRFVGDYTGKVSREEFDALIDQVLKFLNTL